MANEVKVLDTIEVTDLEDNSKLTVVKEYPLPFNIEE
jgi:hypothetical protein